MARGKMIMKFIENEKARATTLRKRMKGLKKKAYEFSVLCDVKVCMIIFEPKLKGGPAKVEVWPSDPVQVKSIVDKYKIEVASDAQKKISSLYDFFNVRKRGVQNEAAQVRKANFKAKFQTWDDRIEDFSPEQIASFLTKLDLNLEVVKKKITMMKGDDWNHTLSAKSRIVGGFNTQSRPHPSDGIPASFHPKNLNHSENHIQVHAPVMILNHLDHVQAFARKNLDFGVSREQPPVPAKPLNIQLPSHSPADEALVKLSLSLNPIENSMNPIDKSRRMSMMNHLDFRLQSGIASSSSKIPNKVLYNPPPSLSVCHDPRIAMPSNVMFNSPTIPVLHHDPRTAMQDDVMFKDPRAFQTRFYVPSMQPEAVHSGQQLMMPLMFPQMHPFQFTDFHLDINEYEMQSKKQRLQIIG